MSTRQSGACLTRLPVSAYADYYKNQVISTHRMLRCFPGGLAGPGPGNDLLDGLLTVFTALFPIRAKTSGSERLTAPPSPVGVPGDLQ